MLQTRECRPKDVDDAMLLDPPDPVDLLIAHTHADQAVNLGARQGELRNVLLSLSANWNGYCGYCPLCRSL